MATDFNITMKQYNGVDYDVLYPKTTAEQIEGNIPVSKVSGTVAVANGGTGATNAASARSNLGAAPAYQYGTTDLTAGTSSLATGTLYFVYE